jgi:biotin carboxyl carrier protein
MPAAKRATTKRTTRKPRKAATRKPRTAMSADFHDLAAEVVGTFTAGVIKRGGSVSARDSKNKDAVQVSAKVGEKKLALRITER